MSLNVPVRQDILTSWRRCLVAGLCPRFEVTFQSDVSDDGPMAAPGLAPHRRPTERER